MIYTGIGARRTPSVILREIYAIGVRLASEGYTLRSGAADGCDYTFEAGCNSISGPSEIYLPWKDFNNHTSPFNTQCDDARELAKDLYGARWDILSHAGKCLMTRNVYQVLGLDMESDSDFVICWTPDGCESENKRTFRTGGTGQAIALASRRNIPVFNLYNHDAPARLEQHLKTAKLWA